MRKAPIDQSLTATRGDGPSNRRKMHYSTTQEPTTGALNDLNNKNLVLLLDPFGSEYTDFPESNFSEGDPQSFH